MGRICDRHVSRVIDLAVSVDGHRFLAVIDIDDYLRELLGRMRREAVREDRLVAAPDRWTTWLGGIGHIKPGCQATRAASQAVIDAAFWSASRDARLPAMTDLSDDWRLRAATVGVNPGGWWYMAAVHQVHGPVRTMSALAGDVAARRFAAA